MRMPLVVLALVTAGIGLSAQTGTDFSGTWVLEGDTRPSPTIARRLVVQQPVTTTTMRGTPMPPAYLWLIVEREYADHTQQDSYNIGVIGGYVGGSANGANAVQNRWSVTWAGDALRMQWTTVSPTGGRIAARTEVWRIDQNGRLVIAIENQDANGVVTQTLSYRKTAIAPSC